MDAISLSPSSLSWLYSECPRCFWLKCKGVVAERSEDGDYPAGLALVIEDGEQVLAEASK